MPLTPRVPDLGAMDMLLSVARLGSLGKAAAEHGVSQPAVSSRISRMERSAWALALIERTATGVGADRVRAAWWPTGRARSSRRRRRWSAGWTPSHREPDRLRIASSMTIAEYLMPTWLSTAHHEEPDLGIALELANSPRCRAACARAGGRPGLRRGAGATARACGRRPSAGTGWSSWWRVDHPWARRRTPLTARELADTPLIQRERGPAPGRRWARRCWSRSATSRRAPPMLELTSTTAIKSAVQNGLAPAVISSIAVADEVDHGRLVAVPVEDLDLSRTLRAVWPSGRALLGPRGRSSPWPGAPTRRASRTQRRSTQTGVNGSERPSSGRRAGRSGRATASRACADGARAVARRPASPRSPAWRRARSSGT